ncbi:putative NADH dehydrogenase [Streptomyces lydicamycinicus]|uniref:Putative NADH dehydrogenase n=1 Tax=Streptomyces lydicamycinicus TaxID=1546107 RepID=A0A0N7YLP5_9ACTN|nr:NADH-quinone oxidoreductase subunit C [Streptomyces lydicamycinicus]GAO09387.1 putative NADH dehydrogenase [Streptomyces lydicamycinicus]
MTEQPEQQPETPEQQPETSGQTTPSEQTAAPEPSAAPDQGQQPEQPPAEPVVGWLPRPASELFGPGATAELAYDLLTVDVPVDGWLTALTAARDTLGCTFFDWLSAVDEPGTGFRICAHLAEVAHPGTVHRLIVRTTVPHDAAALPTAVGVYAGAGWHERETHEMFGVDFTGHPHLVPLLLPENFEGHPLRKDFVLAARVAKAWPGAKEPGESEHGGPKRRQMLPPGVPDPNEWGPLKGQLPPAPARPARGARAAGGAAGERPARRTRTAAAGSAGQQAAAEGTGTPARTERPERPARRTRSVSEGSASQQRAAAEAADAAETAAAPAAGGPATEVPSKETPAKDAPTQDASTKDAPAKDSPAQGTPPQASPEKPAPPRSSDAPWHHARPAFDEPERTAEAGKKPEKPEPEKPEVKAEPEKPEEKPEPEKPEAKAEPDPEPAAPRDQPPTPQDPAGGDTP